MDDLKCMRTLRGHDTAITGVVLLPGGMLASCSEDGTIQVCVSVVCVCVLGGVGVGTVGQTGGL